MKKAGNKASIDALLRRKVSIEVAGISLELQSPTVEQHLEMRQEQVNIRKEVEDKPVHEFMDCVLLVRTCLTGDNTKEDVQALLLALGDESEQLIARCMALYQSSIIKNRDELVEKAKERGLEDIVEEESKIPLSSQESTD